MDATKIMLQDYATQLRQAATKFKASTQPAGGSSGGKAKDKDKE